MLPVKALELMRIAALVLQPVHTLFESAEFGLLGPKLLLRFHFNSLPLLLFRRQTLEFSLAPGNFEFQLFPLFGRNFRGRSVFQKFLTTLQGSRRISPMCLCFGEM